MLTTPVKKHILVAPLDWGLGHTTRCIPIIRHLLQWGHRVTVAGNTLQRNLLAQNIPGLELTDLGGYAVHYSKKETGLLWSLARQIPQIRRRIQEEHEWLQGFCNRERVDGILSDNRYGLHHPGIPSVIITHQLNIQTGWGKRADTFLRIIHYRMFKKFRQCWVADVPYGGGLSGALAHPGTILKEASYIGLLSQLEAGNDKNNGYILILLSGPEPQRTLLSDMLWEQVAVYGKPVVFIEGSAAVKRVAPAHVTHLSSVPRQELQPLLEGAAMVICRSGYSTLMDLVRLQKKAILIPTPGQTEQEYLARYLMREGQFYSIPQKDFKLATAMQLAAAFPYRQPFCAGDFELFVPVLDNWIASL